MPSTALRDVALPARAFAGIREALRRETDPLAAIHAMHAAGYQAGEELWGTFANGTDLAELAERAFWKKFSEFFRSRGWGPLSHDTPHPGIGRLTSPDWAEADGADETQPSCAFSAGMLSSFLTRAAGGGIAVLETSCRSRGDEGCTFAFGSEDAIHRLYGHLLDGRALDEALDQL